MEPNRYEWALTQDATAKLGVILVNVNPAYRTAERFGEEVMAWVIPREDATVDEDELREFYRGKIQKHKLRAQAVETLGLRPDAGVPSA